MNGQAPAESYRERLAKVFEFLKAYAELRFPTVRDIQQQMRVIWLKHLPQHESVELCCHNNDEEETSEDVGVILRVTRPNLKACPSPPPAIGDWLEPGWEHIESAVRVRVSRNIPSQNQPAQPERFEDMPQRIQLLRDWRQRREQWQTTERLARQSMAIFQALYEWFGIQEREAERIEILAADGLLNLPNDEGDFNHPVLLQKLALEFYPEKRSPQFILRKREQPPELYAEFLRLLPEANYTQIASCSGELKKAEFSPFGASDTDGFLQRLIQGVLPTGGQFIHVEAASGGNPQSLTQASAFSHTLRVSITRTGDHFELHPPDALKVTGPITSANLTTSLQRLRDHGWEVGPVTDTGPTIRREPVIFMRQRRGGAGNIFDLILEDIPNRVDFPTALLQIVGLPGTDHTVSRDDPAIFSLGNEDEQILLSKAANREQLEIAQQLARRDCVLVQGPPGTGKTHTIANLLGHLLAQGKRILVTAHTPKALRVLREKVVEALQPLCISVLHNDKVSQDQLQQSVVQINARLAESDRLLEREAKQLKHVREQIITQLRETRARLLDAREDEIRAVVFGGHEISPIEAAKRVKEGIGVADWIPGPVTLGDGMPLSEAEVATLYQTNARFSLEDECELNARRPEIDTLPTPKHFAQLMEEVAALRCQNVHYREELWDNAFVPQDLSEFDRMLSAANKAIAFLKDSSGWEMEAVQAGRDGHDSKQIWISLNDLIESSWQEIQECNGLVMAYGPSIDDGRPPKELLPIIENIIQHVEAGKSFGILTRVTKPAWHQLISGIRIGNNSAVLTDLAHFRAVRALLRQLVLRQELVARWERQITAQGGPCSSDLGDKPEQVCRQFLPRIRACVDWYNSTWLPLEKDFQQLGFGWPAYLESTPPETGTNAELRRLRNAVLRDLDQTLKSRACWLRLRHLEQLWAQCRNLFLKTDDTEATITTHLRESIEAGASVTYEQAYTELLRLRQLEPVLAERVKLLTRLAGSAPAWASAIQNRSPLHSAPTPPGDPTKAWIWRQVHDELERRANVSIDEAQQRIERLSNELLEVTSQLIDKLSWCELIRKTEPEQKRALAAYAAMRKKLTKTGRGVQDAEIRAGARRAMADAKGAVPVWIMPLNEVAEAFDPRTTRFDVVIIDEASQCDPTAMFALYLGKQTLIVGDDEQVTPVAIGIEGEQVQQLRQVHLQGIPHKELYNGDFSIYGFAQVFFGGVIRLVEHFRCAPSIIAFSNFLSYNDEIKPLREASSIKLRPHVLPYRVETNRGESRDVNEVEAEAIASLVCAAMEQPEYATHESGTPMSFGIVSMVGAQQAMKIDSLLRQRLEPAEYKRRQILCGDAAQFQGDERDVMFVSMVDSPPAEPPLPMRQEGPKNIFKKRFNVAASRARDQMWVVHSLDHETDLKPGDYRRRLIEHAIDPEARERELERLLSRVDPQSREFEGRVLRHLVEANFRVVPQHRVGNYRIDLVVVGGGKRLAVECDGERSHGPEKLLDDMERQANLERLGWRFVRIRGSVFFRDEERAMRPLFQRLSELGVTPDLHVEMHTSPTNEVTQRVIARAQEMRATWQEQDRLRNSAGPNQSRQLQFQDFA